MTENDKQRADQAAEPNQAGEATPAAQRQPDSLVDALRDIPKMRAIKDDKYDGKVFAPPPPMMSRFGGVAQGCSGLLLTLLSVPMVLAALWYGYYLWGPSLMLVAGVLLVGTTAGVWAGRRTPIIVSLVVLAGLLLVGSQWQNFIPAAGALAPLGDLALMYTPVSMLVTFALVITFILNAVALAYWNRLKPQQMRGFAIWAGIGLTLIVVSLAFHFMEQNRREKWLDEQITTWQSEAMTDHLNMGTNTNVTLGYSFVTVEEDDDARFDVRAAELRAAIESGASVIRLSAGGDMLWEAETPLMFNDADEKAAGEDGSDEEIAARRAARAERQAEMETQYLATMADANLNLYISDSQYSPYMLMLAADEELTEGDNIPWEDFTALQTERVAYYAEQLQPAYYEIVNEPSAYARFSAVEEFEDEDERLAAWVAHTETLRDVVREASPDTQIGVGVTLASDFDLAFYERVLALDGIDFIGFRVFQPAALDRLEEVFIDIGHPVDNDKTWQITETWYGYCLAPQRSMDIDAQWLTAVTVFTAKENGSGVLPSDFGCFLQAGGTLFGDMRDANNRTAVYDAWRDLVAQWNNAATNEG